MTRTGRSCLFLYMSGILADIVIMFYNNLCFRLSMVLLLYLQIQLFFSGTNNQAQGQNKGWKGQHSQSSWASISFPVMSQRVIAEIYHRIPIQLCLWTFEHVKYIATHPSTFHVRADQYLELQQPKDSICERMVFSLEPYLHFGTAYLFMGHTYKV